MLSWCVSYAVVAMVVFVIAFLRINSGGRPGNLEQLVSGVGPFLPVSIMAATLMALGLCVVGIARWPAQVIRSPRWVLSAIGVLFVLAAAILTAFLAAFIAVQNP